MKFWFPHQFGNPILVDKNGFQIHNDSWFVPNETDQHPVEVINSNMPQEWVNQIQDIKDRIKESSVQKEIAHWDFKFNGGSPIGWLMNEEGNGRFIVQLDDGRLLYGNSPELVLDKNQNTIKIEVLGGTDEWNEKTNEEHSIIIQDLIQRFPEKLELHQTEFIDLGYVKHLRTKLSGTWNHSLQSIIPYVWPNLAIWGKGYGEDYWGGLIGYGDEVYAKLWLCIRCGIWDGEFHHYRVGCGITEQSDPQSEWNELNNKLGWILRK